MANSVSPVPNLQLKATAFMPATLVVISLLIHSLEM